MANFLEPFRKDDEPLHQIFQVDPVKLKTFVHKCVRLKTEDNQEHTGFVYTIDPVTGSYILLKIGDETKVSEVKIVPGHAIQQESIVEDASAQLTDQHLLEKLFQNEDQAQSFTTEELAALKAKTVSWFQSHFMPIRPSTDDPNVLMVMNSLKINPPYRPSDCYCDNEIVLGRVQGLLKAMPLNINEHNE